MANANLRSNEDFLELSEFKGGDLFEVLSEEGHTGFAIMSYFSNSAILIATGMSIDEDSVKRCGNKLRRLSSSETLVLNNTPKSAKAP